MNEPKPRTRPPTTLEKMFPGRNAQLGEIHGLKKSLGWSDSQYRDFLWDKCRVRTAKHLFKFEREFIIALMRGFAEKLFIINGGEAANMLDNGGYSK